VQNININSKNIKDAKISEKLKKWFKYKKHINHISLAKIEILKG
jgi:hypothetical protein